MQVILLMVIGAVFAAALALVRNIPNCFLPDTYNGELLSIHHAQPRTIDVDCLEHTQQKFFLSDKTKIATATNPDAGLQDLKAGDKITIHFSRKGDALWALSIASQK